MRDILVEERVDRLENLMAEVWRGFAETDRRLDERFAETDRRLDERFAETDRRLDERFERTEREIELLSQEVRASTKKWGELSNKMGTLAEDFVAPSIPRILRTVKSCPEEQMDWVAIRFRRRHPEDPGRSQEFDVVAACGEYMLINETKSSLDTKDIDDFVELMSQARDFFPEYADRRFIGAIASLYVDESVVGYGQRRGLLVLGLSEDLIDVLNDPDFEPEEF